MKRLGLIAYELAQKVNAADDFGRSDQARAMLYHTALALYNAAFNQQKAALHNISRAKLLLYRCAREGSLLYRVQRLL